MARSPHSDAFLQQKPWQPVSPHFTEDARPWGFAQSQSENLTGPGDSRVPARALPTTLPDLLLSSLKKQVCQVLKKKNTSTFKCPFPSSIYHPNLILFSFFRVKCIFKKWCRLRLDFLIHPSTEFAFHSHLKNASSHRNVPPGGFPRPRPHYPL